MDVEAQTEFYYRKTVRVPARTVIVLVAEPIKPAEPEQSAEAQVRSETQGAQLPGEEKAVQI